MDKQSDTSIGSTDKTTTMGTCEGCRGTGWQNYRCRTCGGTGHVGPVETSSIKPGHSAEVDLSFAIKEQLLAQMKTSQFAKLVKREAKLLARELAKRGMARQSGQSSKRYWAIDDGSGHLKLRNRGRQPTSQKPIEIDYYTYQRLRAGLPVPA